MPILKLRPYQAIVARCVLEATLDGRGGPFAVIMSRQAGKNETSAYIERALLAAYMTRHRTGIKAAPTLKPQAEISRNRLLRALDQAGYANLVRTTDNTVGLVKARWTFSSAGKDAHVVGQTADILLECDEAQDVDADTWDKRFAPMGAVAAVPTVFYGTPWTEDDLLARALDQARAAQKIRGPQRAFVVPWPEVAERNRKYARYVEAERDRLGANHPLFLTQYECQPIAGAGRLLSAAQLAAMRGDFARQVEPGVAGVYVAGIDVAGEDAASGPVRGRDATVCLIARVTFGDARQPPTARIVAAYEWTGTPHADLYPQIAALMRSWGVRRVAVDATALGEALALYLRGALPEDRVLPVRFTERSKSDLGYALQASATTGRLTAWTNDQSPEYTALFQQLRLCRAEYKPNRTVSWSVPETDGHDDYVAAAALVNHAAEQCPPPRTARGRIAERTTT